MVEQKISQGVRFVVLRVTILLRTMWGKIKENFERVTEYLRNLASSIAQKRGKYTNAYIEANFKSFVSEIDAHLAGTGLSKEEFISLIHKNVEELTEAKIAILQQVRESISIDGGFSPYYAVCKGEKIKISEQKEDRYWLSTRNPEAAKKVNLEKISPSEYEGWVRKSEMDELVEVKEPVWGFEKKDEPPNME